MAEIKHAYYTTDWTLGEMWDFGAHPYMEAIVRYIEPKIVRGVYLPCWKWSGRLQYFHRGKDNQAVYPTVYVPIDMENPKAGRKSVYVHRFMAGQFWHLTKSDIVYRTCLNTDCVNPACFAISYRNDPQYR